MAASTGARLKLKAETSSRGLPTSGMGPRSNVLCRIWRAAVATLLIARRRSRLGYSQEPTSLRLLRTASRKRTHWMSGAARRPTVARHGDVHHDRPGRWIKPVGGSQDPLVSMAHELYSSYGHGVSVRDPTARRKASGHRSAQNGYRSLLNKAPASKLNWVSWAVRPEVAQFPNCVDPVP